MRSPRGEGRKSCYDGRSQQQSGGMSMDQRPPCLAAWTLLALMMAVPSAQAQAAGATPPEEPTPAAGEGEAQTPASEAADATVADEEADTEIDEAEPDFTV